MIAAFVRQFAFSALLVFIAGTAAAWGGITGSGNVQTESRAVSGFTGIALSLPGKLELTLGERESVSISADDNVLPEIETVVERGTLRIRFRGAADVSRFKQIRITVVAKAIDSLAVKGSGDILAPSLRAGELKVAIAGSGDVRLPALSATALSVSISGSGDFSADGKADSLTANIAGSGDIKAGKLAAQRVKIAVAGSGVAVVWARDDLSVNVAGSGDVRYYGDPSVQRAIVGSGSVKRLGATPA